MKFTYLLIAIALVTISSTHAFAQADGSIKRTTYKTERMPFGVGGTVAVVGAPKGSIRVEGWSKNELEITAEIEIQAASEDDIARLSQVTGFVTEETLGRTGVISVGPNDKKALKKIDKKFPKHLIGTPFKINYVLRVPRFTDLQIDGGIGDLSVTGVEGTFRINVLEGDSSIDLVGGGLLGTFGKGRVDITIPTRAWRGRFAEVNLASGDMVLNLPVGLSAELDANILRSGKIENGFAALTPRERKVEFTDRSISATAGSGSIPLKFTVGDGSLKINEINRPG